MKVISILPKMGFLSLTIISFLLFLISISLTLSFSLKESAGLYFLFFSILASYSVAGIGDGCIALYTLPFCALGLGHASTSSTCDNNVYIV